MSSTADHFTSMAARIERIDEAEFAGAVVIVPPEGEPIVFLTTDPKPDLPQFWATVETRVQIKKAEALDRATQSNVWPGRR
jgi:hypothetical protein